MRVEGIDFSQLTVETLLDLLPDTESDQWEWKSATLLEDGKSAELETKLAKGLSAFANTGGGHFILGLENGTKTPKPCRLAVNRQDMETWLHQKIASYVSPPIRGVCIHRIPFANNRDAAIFLIDIPDSSSAPHQAHKDRLYYWRVGPISEKAPHFHVDNLFRRSTVACIDVAIKVSKVDSVAKEWGTCFRTQLSVNLWNGTNVLAKPCACFLRVDKQSDWSFENREYEKMEIQEYLFPGSGISRTIDLLYFVGKANSPNESRYDSPSRRCVRELKALRVFVTAYSHNFRSPTTPFCLGEVVEKQYLIPVVSDSGERWWSGETFRLEVNEIWTTGS